MVQYYSLEEAARMLGVSPEELKKMAQRNEIRSFSDRGSMRFRAQEIEELARRRGRGSDPELQIVDPPSSGKGKKAQAEEVPDSQLNPDDQVEIGQELPAKSGSGSGKKSDKNRPGSKSPPPKPGSDSDVRLVAEGSDLDFEVSDDSKKRRAALQSDSGVRILPLEVQSDSDVKIVPESSVEDPNAILGGQSKKSGSDSDIRLVPDQAAGASASGLRKGKGAGEHVTEEIDLDAEEAELRKSESSRNLGKPPKAIKPKKTGLPTESPFELSDPKLDKDKKGEGKKKETDTSSDFELTPAAAADQSPLELGSDEIPLNVGDEEVQLGEVSSGKGDSGINLRDPADSGISLEQSSEEESLEFDVGKEPTTPKPGPTPVESESDSEFELSGEARATAESHKAAKADVDSDSEFELTLDDSGDLLPLDEQSSAPAAEGEEDIFETDFEVPALDEDSGSEAVALDESDTDLESSDFDLALDEQDASSDEESGSEVVALEDEERADAGASTVARPRKKPAKKTALAAEEIEEEEAEEEEEEAPARRAAVAAAPANWGVLPALVLMPCLLVMFLVTIMGYEMIRGMWGYRQGTPVAAPVTKGIANSVFGQNVP
jgi:excisionase family DNA binding protein